MLLVLPEKKKGQCERQQLVQAMPKKKPPAGGHEPLPLPASTHEWPPVLGREVLRSGPAARSGAPSWAQGRRGLRKPHVLSQRALKMICNGPLPPLTCPRLRAQNSAFLPTACKSQEWGRQLKDFKGSGLLKTSAESRCSPPNNRLPSQGTVSPWGGGRAPPRS